jgi:hypothetical protein
MPTHVRRRGFSVRWPRPASAIYRSMSTKVAASWRSDFDLIVRNLDKAGGSVDACKQADTIAKYAFVDAQRWQIGFDRGWVAAPVAARRIHVELQRLKAIRFDRRDKREYDVVQVQDKALYKKAGLAWEPVH